MYFNLTISRKFSVLKQTHFSPLINSKIKTLVQQGHFSQALQLYTRDPHFPLNTTKFTFPSLLKSCSFLSNQGYGKIIHATIITLGLQFDPFITSSLVNMYVKCDSLNNAVQVFAKMCEGEFSARDVTMWNSMIDGYFRYGQFEEGIVQFRRMQIFGIKPDAFSLSILLRIHDNLPGFLIGKQIHGFIVRYMFDDDPFVVTALIDMYSNRGLPMEAWHIFEKLEDKNNVVAWNAMIGGFSQNGFWEKSLELFCLMKIENCKLISSSYSSALTACSHGGNVGFGKQIHSDVIKTGFQSDPYVCTSLLTMYAKCRFVEDAREVFDSMPDKELELWNAMISAYVGNGCVYDALNVYSDMRLSDIPSDSVTVSNLLASCSMIGLYDLGRTLHGDLIKRPMQSNVAAQSALLTMYSKCSSIEDGVAVFSTINEKDVIAWGSIISGFCQNLRFTEALGLLKLMEADGVEPDSDVMASIISACVGLENTLVGSMFHGYIVKRGLASNAFVGSSLIDMYSKCGFPKMAENVFTSLQQKNLVVWNSMISCYYRNGLPELSIALFPQILQHGLYPDSVSISSILVAVSSVAALLKGKTIHGYQIRLQIPSDLQVENALIDMYIKCGCLKYAERVFQNVAQRNLVTWNSMIAGYGSHGECLKAISLFHEMRRFGIAPDDITFLSLISSCNHSGLVEQGLSLFQSMGAEYNIEPRMEHYVNMVDLLGRAGRLYDTYSFIQKMPIEPDQSVWISLLSASRSHRNVELGELAADNLLKMEPNRGSNYIQLLNLYVEAGLRYRAANLRATMKEKGLKKSPGCSWIEVGNKVDTFFSADSSSASTLEIYETLSSLRSNMKIQEAYHDCVEAF